ncbi:MAG: hypothetical protein R3A11_07105 [Bdellovibrionota bacterium]
MRKNLTWLSALAMIAFAMPCLASDLTLYQRFSLIPYHGQYGFEMDASSFSGVSHQESALKRLSGRTALEISRSQIAQNAFAGNGFDRVAQSNVEIKFLARDYQQGLWVTHFSRSMNRLDMTAFNTSLGMDRHSHGTVSLSQSWKRILHNDLFVELSMGGAKCDDKFDRDSRLFLTYGAKVSRSFGDVKLSFNLAQQALGGGAETGVFGTQKIQKAQVSSTWDITKNLSLAVDCMVAKVASAFEENQNIADKSLIVASSAKIQYSINSNVKAALGYTHRTLLDSNGAYGVQGSIVGASISYSLF